MVRDFRYQPITCNKGKNKHGVFLIGTAHSGWKQSKSLLKQERNYSLNKTQMGRYVLRVLVVHVLPWYQLLRLVIGLKPHLYLVKIFILTLFNYFELSVLINMCKTDIRKYMKKRKGFHINIFLRHHCQFVTFFPILYASHGFLLSLYFLNRFLHWTNIT